MKNISLSIDKALGFVSKETVYSYENKVKEYAAALENGTGKGSDYLGWLHLPSSITDVELSDIEATAKTLREKCEVVIVAGIGGSYLGARSVIEAFSNSFFHLQADKKKSGYPLCWK